MDTVTTLYNEYISPYVSMESIGGLLIGFCLISVLWEWMNSESDKKD